ncbi:MAG: hypothetical protein ACI83H_001034 [Glaciecola sp.]|jgi:hypothetical protein
MQQFNYMLKPTTQLLKSICLIAFIGFNFLIAKAQDVQRIEVNGRIIVDSPDIEGVTVFNASSNKGTITDEEGKFSILVTLNDRLEFSALQFENFVVFITQDIIDSKALTVVLVEEVNKLPEVIILPYGLTGNLTVDAIRAKTFNPNLDALYFGLDNLDKIDFTDDYISAVRNTAMPDNRFYYAADAIKIIGLLVKPLFKSKKNRDEATVASDRDIVEKYSPEYLMDKLNIPKHQMNEFIYFVEDSGMDKTLLEDGKELQFLDYIIKKSKEFQVNKNGKD